MEHIDAIETEAVERYLLEEMTEEERAVFEEHFVDCRVCAAGIMDGTRLLVVGREVAKERSNVVPFRKRFDWISAATAASVLFSLLGAVAGYQFAERQREPATEIVSFVRIDTGVSRSEAPREVLVRTGDELRFDVAPSDDAASYAAVVRCGEFEVRKDISRKQAAEEVSLRLELPAGRCELGIEGVRKDGNRFEIAKSPFRVEER